MDGSTQTEGVKNNNEFKIEFESFKIEMREQIVDVQEQLRSLDHSMATGILDLTERMETMISAFHQQQLSLNQQRLTFNPPSLPVNQTSLTLNQPSIQLNHSTSFDFEMTPPEQSNSQNDQTIFQLSEEDSQLVPESIAGDEYDSQVSEMCSAVLPPQVNLVEFIGALTVSDQKTPELFGFTLLRALFTDAILKESSMSGKRQFKLLDENLVSLMKHHVVDKFNLSPADWIACRAKISLKLKNFRRKL